MTPQAAAAKVAQLQSSAPADVVVVSARARWVHALTRVALVIAIVAMSAAIPTVSGTGGHANAAGFSCKEPPRPELPSDAGAPAFFDARSKGAGHDKPPPGYEAEPSGYENYGWAGLSWSTYDLGCGEDMIPAGEASRDTALGNFLLSTGKVVMAIAFWLDDQAKTPAEAREQGITTNGLEKIDALVTKIVKQISDKGVVSQFLALAVMLAACLAGVAVLRADTAKVFRIALLCGTAFGLAALFVGAPQKAINTSDEVYASVVSGAQSMILDGGDGQKQTPRNVLMDKVLIPEWERGWFGSTYADDPQRRTDEKLGSTLRDAVAISYDEQTKIQKTPEEGKSIIEAKKKKWENEVVKPLESKGLSYYTLQGKDSSRTTVGAMAAFKTITPSTTWIAGSLLKLMALIIVRFAILLAPIWIPIVMIRQDFLTRAFQIIGGGYAWGFIGGVLTAVYLSAMVMAYDTTDKADVDGSWRVWLMLLLAVVCWSILRPFKRIRQIASPNGAASRGVLSRITPNRRPRMRISDHSNSDSDDDDDKRSFGSKASEAASWLFGGPAQAAAEGAVSGAAQGGVQRPEGQLIERTRHQRANDARVAAEMAGSRRISEDDPGFDSGRHRRGEVIDGEVISSTIASPERDDRGVWVTPAGHGRGGGTGVATRSSEVPTQWDGGPNSPIAPVTLYRPSAAALPAAPSSRRTSVEHIHNFEITRGSRHAAPSAPAAPAQAIWDNNDELGVE